MKSVVYYAPNYIGYVRIVCTIGMLYFLRRNPFLAFILVVISGFVDHFDGDLARESGETSKLGALIDFGCDKMSCKTNRSKFNSIKITFLTQKKYLFKIWSFFLRLVVYIQDIGYFSFCIHLSSF